MTVQHLQFMQMWIKISQVQPYNYTDTEDVFDAEKSPFDKEIETTVQENQQNNASDSQSKPILSTHNSRISVVGCWQTNLGETMQTPDSFEKATSKLNLKSHLHVK